MGVHLLCCDVGRILCSVLLRALSEFGFVTHVFPGFWCLPCSSVGVVHLLLGLYALRCSSDLQVAVEAARLFSKVVAILL